MADCTYAHTSCVPPAVFADTVNRYTQCELMSAHYKQPILLIEFEEHKSFALEVCLGYVCVPLTR